MGNSGPLDKCIGETIDKHDLIVGAVLSGNRNFEGRVHPQCGANYLASPPLVVAYALPGSLHVNLTTDPLGQDEKEGIFIYVIFGRHQQRWNISSKRLSHPKCLLNGMVLFLRGLQNGRR